jgi:pyridoxine 5-phosphate synthase
MKLKLGINIDHVATLRQARYAKMPDAHNAEPSLLAAALMAEAGGADSITIHLREDRRHIQDADVAEIRAGIGTKLNLEMGNAAEIVAIAVKTAPDFVCLVPENREEITTEGGLAVANYREALEETVARLQGVGTQVSMFIDPDPEHIDASVMIGADMVELHTGAFANAVPGSKERADELARLVAGAERAHAAGLQVNAGHGITTENLRELFAVPHMVELNIGHHIVSRAVFIGLKAAVEEMRAAMGGY